MQLEILNFQIYNLVDKITQTTQAIGKVLEERLGKLISECDGVRSELDKLGGSKLQQSYETVIPMLERFAEMPVNVQRQIAGELFIRKVLLWENRLEIQWKFWERRCKITQHPSPSNHPKEARAC